MSGIHDMLKRYSRYRGLTHTGAAMIGRSMFAGGFLGTALYHQERLFAEWFQWREMR